MSDFALETLVTPVAEDAPSGPPVIDDDYDASEALEAALGRPTVRIGDDVTEGIPTDVAGVRRIAGELFGRTKDMRVALALAAAELQDRGPAGLADGLDLLAALFDRYWETLHPDPDDPNGPRVMQLGILATPGIQNNPHRFIDRLQTGPMLPGFSSISFRDLKRARGEEPIVDPEEPSYSEGEVDTAFNRAGAERIAASRDGCVRALASLRGLEDVLDQKADAATIPSFAVLRDQLEVLGMEFAQRLAAAGGAPVEGAGADGGDGETTGGNGGGDGGGATGGGPGLRGTVASRDDALRALDLAADWFRRAEPGSPVPYFLDRAGRLARMSFVEIVQDLNVQTSLDEFFKVVVGSVPDSDD